MRKLLAILLLTTFASATAAGFMIDTVVLKSVVAPGETEVGGFIITNTDNVQREFSVHAEPAIADIPNKQFLLRPGDKWTVEVLLNQPARINTFEIVVGSGIDEERIPVIVELEDDKRTFDLTIEINETTRKVTAGEKMRAHLDFFALEDIETQKLSVEYIVLDTKNDHVISEVDDIFVSNRKFVNKEFRIPSYLNSGTYVLAVVVNHNTQWSTATTTFEVEAKESFFSFGNVDIIGIIAFLIIGSILYLLMRNTHFHVRGLRYWHQQRASELKQKRLHAKREKHLRKLHALDAALEQKVISKEKHAKAHKHIRGKIASIHRQLGNKVYKSK